MPFYIQHASSENTPQTQDNKWNGTLASDLSWKIDIWSNYKYNNLFKTSFFQYRYLMHILPNRKQLFKYGIIESSLFHLFRVTTKFNVLVDNQFTVSCFQNNTWLLAMHLCQNSQLFTFLRRFCIKLKTNHKRH